MAFGIVPCPFRFASCVVADVHEADDRDPRHLGAWGVSGLSVLRKQKYGTVTFLGEADGLCFSGSLVTAIETQDPVDMSRLVPERKDEQPSVTAPKSTTATRTTKRVRNIQRRHR